MRQKIEVVEIQTFVHFEPLKNKFYKVFHDELLFTEQNLTIEKLAKHLDISQRELSIFFKRALNTKFRDYLNQTRTDYIT